MKNFTTCPKCLGAQEIMEPKERRGFEYKECNVCNATGIVSEELADDYIFSINEDNFEEEL